MIVVDASLTVDLCVSAKGRAMLMAELEAQRTVLVAPQILDLEFVHTLRRLVRRSDISMERAEQAFANFEGFDIRRLSHAPLLSRIWDLRDNLGAYDAAYFALAEWLDAPLWTRDQKFASVPSHGATIRVL